MRYLLMIALAISTQANAIGPTPTPGSVITSVSTAGSTSGTTAAANATASEASNDAAAAAAAALGKVWPNCDEKVNNAVAASADGQKSVLDKNISEVKKAVDEVGNCLAAYKNAGAGASFSVPTTSSLLAAATAAACSAVNSVAGAVGAKLNQGVYYNNGIISAGGSINPSLLGGTGSGGVGVSLNGNPVAGVGSNGVTVNGKPVKTKPSGSMPSAL